MLIKTGLFDYDVLVSEGNDMKNRAFTLVELLVVISIIAVLLAILVPSLRAAREKAQKVVCLSNEKQLGLAWMMYANANDGRIVYGGDVPVSQLTDPAEITWHQGDTPWAIYSSANSTYEEQKDNIQKGALWPYVKQLDIYRCPHGEKDKLRTYSIVDGLNSIHWMAGTQNILVKKITELRTLAERIVFIDEGGVDQGQTNMGWCIYYLGPKWWDAPPLRHRNGTTLSFADGHAEFLQWKDPRTIQFANDSRYPNYQAGNPDLIFMQKGVWGGLGYKP